MRKENRMTTFRIIRAIHLYSGLFLIPWMLVYGASAFVINHSRLFQKEIKRSDKFEKLYEMAFIPEEDFPSDPREQAKVILESLDLAGLQRVVGKPTPEAMIIFRPSPGGAYRIHWRPKESRIVVTRQPFSILRTINYLHFRAGYQQKNLAFDGWALVVDLVALSILLWIISGIYMMIRNRERRNGATSVWCQASFSLQFLSSLFYEQVKSQAYRYVINRLCLLFNRERAVGPFQA